MGNRAVLKFKNNKGSYSKTGIYLHWNGGRASIEGFLLAAKTLNIRPCDDSYGIARLTQIISNWLGGTNSIGVDYLQYLDQNNYDNGVYIINNDFEIVGREFERGSEEINKEKTLEMAISCIEVNLPIFFKDESLEEFPTLYKSDFEKVKEKIEEFKQELIEHLQELA